MPEWNDLVDGFDEQNVRELIEFIEQQRWFGGKGRGVAGISLADRLTLSESPLTVDALVEVRDGAGSSDVYQLILEIQPSSEEASVDVPVTRVGNLSIFDGSTGPAIARLLFEAQPDGLVLSGDEGEMRFRTIRRISAPSRIRRLPGEQSHTSVAADEQLLLKMYRRLEAGTNPELEMLLFLTEHDFENVPQLAGWYSYFGPTLRTTMGLAQRFIPNAIDGWTLALDELSSGDDHFIERLGRLGNVVGEMHCVLASEHDDPNFAPELPSDEAAAILGARLAAQIEALNTVIPDGRAAELLTLASMLTEHPIPGQLIRLHGDLHLGQVLWTGSDWLVIDFEGEPARTLAERRQKLHPLRDVAGMLRSFSYLVAALRIENSITLSDDWGQLAGDEFLAAYRSSVATAGLLPADLEVQDRLLRIFELEKILYELDYEIHHRPAWVPVPLEGIERLLASQVDKSSE